jgi:hypothetical protein
VATLRGDAEKRRRCGEAAAGDRRTAAAAQRQPYRSRGVSGGLVADNVSIYFSPFLSASVPSGGISQ